jgi:RNA polymerase sigma-70 factor (ECF subfamily)
MQTVSITPKHIREGDRAAFNQVFEEYYQKLYQYIYKFSGSAYYAEETVQLAFVKLWEKREGLSDQYSISTQLFRVARSILVDLLRKEQIRSTQELSDVFISNNLQEEHYIYKEELGNVFAAIDELPAQCQQVFRLSRFNQLSHNEISEQLSISPKTIETHITKALKYLKKSITLFF